MRTPSEVLPSKLIAAACLLTLCCVTHVKAQRDAEETIDVRTRVVFVDALVKDKKTGAPVENLDRSNFTVLDNGRPRTLSYFTRDGNGRPRPLAIILVLDLTTSGIRFLEKPEVVEQIIAGLGKLEAKDEIAVLQTWYEPQPKPLTFKSRSRMVEGFTTDRAKTAAALRSVQQFAHDNLPKVKMFFSLKDMYNKKTIKKGILEGLKTAAGAPPTEPPIDVTVAPDYINIIEKAPLLATAERPESQVIVVDVTDDLEGESFSESKRAAQALLRSNVIISGVVVERNAMGTAVDALGHVVAPLFRARVHAMEYYSAQTGGELESAGRPEEFAAAINKIIGNLSARYSLGFRLEENERDDGRMHKLEVKVKADEGRGKRRKLVVHARRGYYSPKS